MTRMSDAAEEHLTELLADKLDQLLQQPLWDAATLAADVAHTVSEWLGDDNDEDLWP